MSTRHYIRTTFHMSAVAMYLAALIAYELLPPMPHQSHHEHFAGRLKYLTYWNVWIQFLYFCFSLYIDCKKTSARSYQKITKLRDRMFASLALPYGLFVFSIFWILYMINRELIFPRVLDSIFPSWLNHVSHTAIVPALLVETVLIKHHHPKRKDGIRILLILGLTYITWVLYLALVMDIWVYPILKILNWGMRGVFFGTCFVVILMMYLLGEKINSALWS